MEELEKRMEEDGVKLKNLHVYSDCAPGDQKNRFFVYHLSELLNKHKEWIPVRYFQRPGNHNKWDFDSAGGFFKRVYLRAALNPTNKTLQWTILEDNGVIQLKEIVKFMNSGKCRWKVIMQKAKTVFRKAILLPDIEHINSNPFPI